MNLATSVPLGAAEFDAGQLLLPILLLLFVILMWSRSRKTQQALVERRAQVQPGARVMSSAGIYGTVVSRDDDANKAVVEIAPGVQVTFHLGVLTPEPETTTEPAGAEAAPETQTAPETETPSSDEGTGSHIADPRETK